jgi:hypothetical protein
MAKPRRADSTLDVVVLAVREAWLAQARAVITGWAAGIPAIHSILEKLKRTKAPAPQIEAARAATAAGALAAEC